IICSPMTSLKTSIKTITYLSDIGCLEIQGASLVMLIPVHSLATKLGVIALTFVLSVLISLAALSSTLLRKVITL
ncbi:MAG: hypothetical protein RBR83_20915, partial [Klebsiella pneumoniae]|nr:hypothetical protein [Klebsiella pneumoniae]